MAKVLTKLTHIRSNAQSTLKNIIAELSWPERLEGIILLLATPFLLFPTQVPLITVTLLISLSLLWIVSPLPSTTSQQTILVLIIALTTTIAIIISADPSLTLPKAMGLILGIATWRYLLRISKQLHIFILLLIIFFLLSFTFTGFGTFSTNWSSKIPVLRQIIDFLPVGSLNIPQAGAGGVHANQLAGTILFFWPLLLALSVKEASTFSWLKIGVIITTALIFLLLLLTQSRSGWLGAASGVVTLLFCWSLLWSPKRRLLARLLLGTFVLAMILAFLWIDLATLRQIWSDPTQQTAFGSLSSIGFRQEVWRWSIIAIGDFPITGTGLGTFRTVVHRLYPFAITPSYDIAHAHNIFLQTALDLGLPGLIAYLSLLGISLWQGWQVAKQNVDLRPFAIGLIASQVAFHIFGLTDAIALGAKPSLLFWFNLALLAILYNLTFPRPKSG